MIPYAEAEIFTSAERGLYNRARFAVAQLPNRNMVRCHELARAFGQWLDLEVVDGYFGWVEHSWLWTTPTHPDLGISIRSFLPNILDTYVPGVLPQVQLYHTSCVSLPLPYRAGPARTDIQTDVVESVLAQLKALP